MNAPRFRIGVFARCLLHAALAALLVGALDTSLAACGSSGQTTTSTDPAAIPPSPSLTGDYDGDDEYASRREDADNDDSRAPTKDTDNDADSVGGGLFDGDDRAMSHFGRLAGPADWRTIAASVRRYFAAAAARNGAAACSMMAPLAPRLRPETLVGPDGPLFLRGQRTCAGVMSLIFAHFHRQIAAHATRLTVSRVRVQQNEGIVGLSFGTLPNRELRLARVGGVWKIEDLLDAEPP